MREIKFRRWHKDLQDMVYSGNLSEFFWIIDRFPLAYEVMQFTGLVDTNDNEIYEGDIVSNDVAIWEVLFNTGCFAAKCLSIPIEERELHIALRAVKEIKVIGNKFENPELLKR